MAENTNLMSTYLAREALTLKLAPSNLDGSGDSREFSDYGPLTLRFYGASIFTNQPTTYGFLLNIAYGTKNWESHQLWLEQPNGNLYHRGTNGDTYNTNPAFKKILDDSNYADVLDNVYVNVSGDTMTGPLTFTNDNGIYYQGTQASYRMIRFIDNTTDTYGNGIAIGGGGQVIIGGGESANAAVAQAGTAGAEIMYICNDGDVLIHSNMQNGWDSRKTWTFDTSGNLVIPGTITRSDASVNWIQGRDTAIIRTTGYTGYSAITSLKTTDGDWSMGVYSNNNMYFVYTPDAKYTAGDNTGYSQVRLEPDGTCVANFKGGTFWLNGKGTNYIANGANDAANGVGGALNNLVISSWYGVSFTTGCAGTYQNTNSVSINCRTGQIYAVSLETTSHIYSTGAGDHYVIAKNTTTGSTVYLDSGGGTNHGIYSAGYYNGTSFTSDPKWLVYRDSGNNILLNGDAVRAKFGDSGNGTHDANSMTTNGFYYYSANGPTAAAYGSETSDAGMFVQAYNTNWVGQIAQDYRTGQLWARGKNNGSWASWKKVVMADDASTTLTNCNSVKHTGIWTCSGFTNRPSKVSNWGSLFNIRLYKDNNNFHRQLFFDCYATNRIWTRSDNAGTWTVWREVLTNATTFSVRTNVTFTNGYGTYRDDRIAGNSKVIVGGNNSGSTGVVFSVETFTGGVGIHACKVYNGAGGTLSWSGTLNNIYIFVDNSDV